MFRKTILFIGILLLSGGCYSNRVAQPSISPSGAARRAMELYDKNKDGKLTKDEFSPGMAAFAKTADANKDGALTEEEIKTRFEDYVESRIGLHDMGGLVLLDGAPLKGATVKFIPDPVLEGIIKPAAGTTDDDGFVALKIEGNDLPGINPGIYRIEVSKVGASNREMIPEKFNKKSQLGEEVGPAVNREVGPDVGPATSLGGWKLELKS